MVKEFILKWEKYKGELENYIKTTKQSEYDEYEKLVKLLFDYVINNGDDNYYEYNTDKITVLDDGDYQGTQIFILHKRTYQPDIGDYVYTHNYYGSCSGCDTLLSISNYSDGIPNEQQVKEYMQLCLNLLQQLRYFKENNI